MREETDPDNRSSTSFVLDQFLPYRLNHLANRVSDSLSQVYRTEFGLTIYEWRAFALYGEHERLTAKEITSMSRMDKTRVSRVIANLDRKDLIEKQPHETDKRATYIALNEKGQKLLDTVLPRALAWEDRLFQAFDTREYQELFRIITKLDNSVPKYPDARKP